MYLLYACQSDIINETKYIIFKRINNKIDIKMDKQKKDGKILVSEINRMSSTQTSAKIKMFIRDDYKQLYTNTFDELNAMNQFFKRHI